MLELVAERTFSRRDFVERSDGSIRIAPDLVQLLAATMPMWARAVAPYAEQLAHLLGRCVDGKWQARTPLTGRNHRAAQARVRARQPGGWDNRPTVGRSAQTGATCGDWDGSDGARHVRRLRRSCSEEPSPSLLSLLGINTESDP